MRGHASGMRRQLLGGIELVRRGVSPLVTSRVSASCSSNSTAKNTSGAGEHVRDVTPLPEPPYNLPDSPLFAEERGGGFQRRWLEEDLPQLRAQMRTQQYLPSKEELWRSAPHEALEEITRRKPYHDALTLIMEHSFFFLFDVVMCSDDAPLPHVVYEDFMKCLTFSSLQCPPEDQFALSPAVLRALLCTAAHHCIVDPHYFTTAAALFRRVEQQQHIGSEVWSAWVHVCVAAGRLEEAIAHARHMAASHIPFDPAVFALLQHPSVSAVQVAQKQVPVTAHSFLMQQRLCEGLGACYSSDTVAVHAAFVHCVLTLRQARKWEVLRVATERGCVLSQRTLRLVVHLFSAEKGVRCGAHTMRALVRQMARPGSGSSAAELLYVLLRARKNELVPALAGLPRTAFTEEEQEEIMACVHSRATVEPAVRAAASLIHTLLTQEDPTQLFTALSRFSASSDEADDRSHHLESDGGAEATIHSTSDSNRGVGHVNEDSEQHILEAVRNVLREVRALDAQSATPLGGGAPSTANSAAIHSAASIPAADNVSETRHLLAELSAQGTHASLMYFVQRTMEDEAEEERYRAQVAGSWVAPGYTPPMT